MVTDNGTCPISFTFAVNSLLAAASNPTVIPAAPLKVTCALTPPPDETLR
jgi:hypothetical protein